MQDRKVLFAQALHGSVLFVGAGAFATLIAIAAVINPALTVPTAAAAALFLCIFFDFGLFLIRQRKTQRTDWESKASAFERVALTLSIVKSAFGLLVVLAFGVLGAYAMLYTNPPMHVGWSLYVQFVAYSFYFVFIHRLIRKATGPVASILKPKDSPTIPRYRLNDNGLTLDLAITDLRDGNKRYTVDFTFNELDTVECMTYWEAKQYVAYHSGLKLKEKFSATFKEIKGEVEYLQGKIPRPTYYMRINGHLPVLILRGKDIFYVVSVTNRDNDKLLAAYAKQKARA